jgi:hypothetical protein
MIKIKINDNENFEIKKDEVTLKEINNIVKALNEINSGHLTANIKEENIPIRELPTLISVKSLQQLPSTLGVPTYTEAGTDDYPQPDYTKIKPKIITLEEFKKKKKYQAQAVTKRFKDKEDFSKMWKTKENFIEFYNEYYAGKIPRENAIANLMRATENKEDYIIKKFYEIKHKLKLKGENSYGSYNKNKDLSYYQQKKLEQQGISVAKKLKKYERLAWTKELVIEAIKTSYFGSNEEKQLFGVKLGRAWEKISNQLSALRKSFEIKPADVGIKRFIKRGEARDIEALSIQPTQPTQSTQPIQPIPQEATAQPTNPDLSQKEIEDIISEKDLTAGEDKFIKFFETAQKVKVEISLIKTAVLLLRDYLKKQGLQGSSDDVKGWLLNHFNKTIISPASLDNWITEAKQEEEGTSLREGDGNY